jgi:hypothetical protein
MQTFARMIKAVQNAQATTRDPKGLSLCTSCLALRRAQQRTFCVIAGWILTLSSAAAGWLDCLRPLAIFGPVLCFCWHSLT